eukprot:CAMPEP_0172299480 /NCGR_PEP_ID=MMETSP1058-20130122/1777_1 /TAXON_ID=83371 /ORGANISM="Detonula confervacea, Strain CCMP 353" /LENGTH=53 /DNA_ID=CAMNT_0013008937 /DNA_START=307 /DNA_END=464 /DNA_ORIENTATION=-
MVKNLLIRLEIQMVQISQVKIIKKTKNPPIILIRSWKRSRICWQLLKGEANDG